MMTNNNNQIKPHVHQNDRQLQSLMNFALDNIDAKTQTHTHFLCHFLLTRCSNKRKNITNHKHKSKMYFCVVVLPKGAHFDQ